MSFGVQDTLLIEETYGCPQGGAIPCGNCSKLLASHHMLRDHQKGCIQESKFTCEECGWEYVTKQGLRQHTRVTHGPEQPVPDEVFICPYCAKQFGIKKSMREHATTCSQNPAKKGLSSARWRGVSPMITPSVE